MSERAAQHLRIGWVGFHEEGRLAFEALLDLGYGIQGVVTLEPEALRHRSGGIDYAAMCAERNIPLLQVRNVNEPHAVSWLHALNLDLLLVIGWSQILRADVLAVPRIAAIGAHASLLPNLRGSAPINWAIIRGLSRTGNSLLRLTEKVDEGRVLDQEAFDITLFDTCGTLYERVACTNKNMLLRVLPRLAAGEMPGFEQPSDASPNLPRRKPEDGRIVWTEKAFTIYNLIRAVTHPYPGAFFFFNGRKTTVWNACLLPGEFVGLAGEVVGPANSPIPQACGQVVVCDDGGGLLLLEIELEDGKRLNGIELAVQNWHGIVLE